MSGRSRFPFTPSQWQELEHQALIYKYMVSGMSIPPDLLFSIKRSCLDSPLPSKLFPHHPPHIGWSCFQMGLGRKIDPEPGRCRRTDGKKWRCSKEAFGESKYCERHMHRGKNRSRKPVEVFKTSSPVSTTTNSNPSPPPTISSIKNHNPQIFQSSSGYNNTPLDHQPFLYHHSSSSRPPGIGLSHQEKSTTSLFLDSAGSYPQANPDYRYAYGMKEEVGEHAFFSEPSGNIRGFSGSSSMEDSWQFTPLKMSTSSSTQRNCSVLQSEQHPHPYLHLESKQHKQDHDQQQFYGSDKIKLMDRNEGTQKTIHRFFDEWPLKDRDSWLDLDDKSSSSSNTRLSISIPTSAHDFPIFTSRHDNDH